MTPEITVPLVGALVALLGVVTGGLALIIKQYGRFVDDQRVLNQELDDRNTKLARQVNRLIGGLKTTRAALRETRAENTTLKGDIQKLKDELQQAHGETDSLRRDIRQLQQDRASDREQLQQRDAELLHLRARLQRRTACARRLLAVARAERGMMHTLTDELEALKPKYDAAVTRGNEKAAALESERRSTAALREQVEDKQAVLDNWTALARAIRAAQWALP